MLVIPMTIRMTADQIRQLRLRAQRLDAHRSEQAAAGVAEMVGLLGGVQAQEPAAAALALRPRSRDIRSADIEQARLRERSVIRTWAMRGTLHLIATADLGWLLPLLGPPIIAAGKRRKAELGVGGETSVRGVNLIRTLLAHNGPLTRAEIAAHLASHGLPAEGQAPYHLLQQAGLEGVICFGPDRDGKPTFVLLDDWVAHGPPRAIDNPAAELARRYLWGYGPAGPEDFAVWSGLPMAAARSAWRAIGDDVFEIEADGRSLWMLNAQRSWLETLSPEPAVRLLPAYDAYLLGYRDRDLAVAPEYARRVHPGGGVLRPVVLVDGQALGAWRLKPRRLHLDVVVEPFEVLDDQVQAGVEAEVADIGRFYSQESRLEYLTEPP